MVSTVRVLALALVLGGAVCRAAGPGEGPLEAGIPFIQSFGPKDYHAGASNWRIVQDPRGVIYVGNEDGVLEFDGQRWRLIRVSNQTLARTLVVDAAGRVWVGAVGEIGYLEPDASGQMRYVSLLERLPAEARDFADVWTGHAGKEGIFFVARKWLFAIRGADVRALKPETTFGRSFEVRGRTLVLRPEGGILEVIDGRLVPVPGSEAFTREKTYVMLPWEGTNAPPVGTVLVGGWKSGLSLAEGSRLRPFSVEAGEALRRELVYSAARLDDGRLAVGTMHGGLWLFDASGRWLGRLDRAIGLPDDGVMAVSRDRDGGLWLGLNRGIARVQVGSPLTRFDDRAGLSGAVLSLHRHGGRLWVGPGQGLFRLEPGPEARFRPVPGIQTQSWDFLSIGETLLVASHEGVFEVRGDRAETVRKELPSSVLMASRRAPGRVFVGFQDGLVVLRRDGSRWVDEGRVAGVAGDVGLHHDHVGVGAARGAPQCRQLSTDPIGIKSNEQRVFENS